MTIQVPERRESSRDGRDPAQRIGEFHAGGDEVRLSATPVTASARKGART
jgi:hypothetical protein